jgi:hypothetical protein
MTYVATHSLNPKHLQRNAMAATLAHARGNVETRRDYSALMIGALCVACASFGAAMAVLI